MKHKPITPPTPSGEELHIRFADGSEINLVSHCATVFDLEFVALRLHRKLLTKPRKEMRGVG